MNLTPRLLSRSAAVLAVAALLASPAAADAEGGTHADRPSGPHAAVTWDGWRGVRFGDTFASAHRSVGGELTRGSNDPGACGDILETSTGTIDAKVGPHAHRVSDVSVSSSVSYPLGIRSTMAAERVSDRLKDHGFVVRVHRVDQTGHGDFVKEYTSVGPHGHTLYFSSDPGSGRVDRMGLALDRHVAHELLGINGC